MDGARFGPSREGKATVEPGGGRPGGGRAWGGWTRSPRGSKRCGQKLGRGAAYESGPGRRRGLRARARGYHFEASGFGGRHAQQSCGAEACLRVECGRG